MAEPQYETREARYIGDALWQWLKQPEPTAECFPWLHPDMPEAGSRYPDKGCYRVGCPIHGGPDGVGGIEAETDSHQSLMPRK